MIKKSAAPATFIAGLIIGSAVVELLENKPPICASDNYSSCYYGQSLSTFLLNTPGDDKIDRALRENYLSTWVRGLIVPSMSSADIEMIFSNAGFKKQPANKDHFVFRRKDVHFLRGHTWTVEFSKKDGAPATALLLNYKWWAAPF